MFNRSIRTALLAAAGTMFMSSGASALTQLTILHSNDGESQLNETVINGQAYGGAARFVTAFNTLRNNAIGLGRDVLSISSGDNFLAGPQFNASLTSGTFYDARILNAVDFDAVVLGNHEFDFGTEVLAQFIGQTESSIPFISANLDFSNVPSLQALAAAQRIAPYTIVTRGTERYAIVGATTEELPIISSPGGVIVNPVVSAVQTQIDFLETQGVNKIIFASHLQRVEVDQAVLSQLRGVDVVIAGGSSVLFSNSIPVGSQDPFQQVVAGKYPQLYKDAEGRDVPVVTTAGDYRYLGQLNATFSDEGVLLSIDQGSDAVLINQSFAPDQNILDTVVNPVAQSVAAIGANVIGTSAVALDGRREIVRTRQTNLGSLVADAFIYEARQLDAADGNVLTGDAVVSITNSGGIRNANILAPGNITELTTFQVLPFSNFLSVINDVSVAQLDAILEFSVGAAPAQNGRFGQVGGLGFVYDPTKVAGDRVDTIFLLDGTQLLANGEVVFGGKLDIVTNSFTAAGGDGYPFAALGLTFENYGTSYQGALFNYIRDGLGGNITVGRYGANSATRIQVDAVPEPASWALMIGGFGLAGAALRRRRSTQVVFA